MDGQVTHPTAEAMSREFARLMRKELSADAMQEVVAHPKASKTCRSHDFVDSNMVMLEAYDNLHNHPVTFDDLDMELMNAAWELAIEKDWWPPMEDATYCAVLEVEEFCPCCSIVDDLVGSFKELLTAEDPRPRAHVVATEYGSQITAAWNRIAAQFNHPGAGFTLTYNENFIVVSEPI